MLVGDRASRRKDHMYPSLPSLTVSALLVPLPFSSWLIRHSEIDAATPSSLPNLPLTEDHRPYLSPPPGDRIEPIEFPGEEGQPDTTEFSFRSAWELTRSLESMPPAFRPIYRRYNRLLSEKHNLSMAAGGAHRFPAPIEFDFRQPVRPPSPTILSHAMTAASASGRARDMRARIYRRLGIVRCKRTNRLARDPDSSWTSHAGLDRRVLWAHT